MKKLISKYFICVFIFTIKSYHYYSHFIDEIQDTKGFRDMLKPS